MNAAISVQIKMFHRETSKLVQNLIIKVQQDWTNSSCELSCLQNKNRNVVTGGFE